MGIAGPAAAPVGTGGADGVPGLPSSGPGGAAGSPGVLSSGPAGVLGPFGVLAGAPWVASSALVGAAALPPLVPGAPSASAPCGTACAVEPAATVDVPGGAPGVKPGDAPGMKMAARSTRARSVGVVASAPPPASDARAMYWLTSPVQSGLVRICAFS